MGTTPRINSRTRKVFKAGVEVFVSGEGMKLKRLAATTRDVSRTGCSLELEMPFEPKSVITILVEVPAGESGMSIPYKLKTQGTVRWLKDLGDGKYGVGVEFKHLPKAEIEAWNDLLRRWTASLV